MTDYVTPATPAAQLFPPSGRPASRSLRVLAWVLQVLMALMLLAAGASKLAGVPAMVQQFDTLGLGQWFRMLTGALEVLGAIGLLVPRTAFYAAVLLMVVMVGAVISHLTVLGGSAVPAAVLLVVLGMIAYLRRPTAR